MSFSSLLVQRCTIKRSTKVKDNLSGIFSTSWATLATDVRCRLERIGNFTSILAQTPTGQTSRNEYICFFNKDQDVNTGDRIELDGMVLTVTPSLAVYDSSALHHKEIFCSIEET